MFPFGRRRGFTLVELLVVIAIIAMLMALVIPAVQMVREKARMTHCSNNLQQLIKAALNFENTKERMPGFVNQAPNPTNGQAPAQPVYVGWTYPMLPFIERKDLHDLYTANVTSFLLLQGTQPVTVPTFVCPSDSQKPTGGLSYVVNGGRVDQANPGTPLDYQENGVSFNQITNINGKSYPPVNVSMSFVAGHDGTANTIALSENVNAERWFDVINLNQGQPGNPATGEWKQCIVWDPCTSNGQPKLGLNKDRERKFNGNAQITDNDYSRPSSEHSAGGFHVAYCGGNVGFMSEEVDYRVYVLLMTPDGNHAKEPGTGVPVQYYRDWLLSGTPVLLKPLTETDLNK